MNLFERFKTLLASNQVKASNFTELSYVGHRNTNQDYATHLFSPQGKLFIVADGLGGHQGGELASRYFCEAFLILAKQNLNKLKKQAETTLISLAENAAETMSDKIMRDYPGVKAHTTCAICWLSADNKLSTLHIGDTRIYWISANKLIWRSRDHSVIQMKVDRGEIHDQQMGTHPDQGALTRSIGVGKKINPSYKTHTKKLSKGDALLLCTDGFWERITQNEIISLAKIKKPEQEMTTWIKTAINRAQPNSDNVTAQLFII